MFLSFVGLTYLFVRPMNVKHQLLHAAFAVHRGRVDMREAQIKSQTQRVHRALLPVGVAFNHPSALSDHGRMSRQMRIANGKLPQMPAPLAEIAIGVLASVIGKTSFSISTEVALHAERRITGPA
jgi:hypothetical protein